MKLDYWQGENIRLRAVEAKDIEFFEEIGNEGSKYVDEIPFPQTLEQKKAWLHKESQRLLGDKFRFMAENEAGQTVGTIQAFLCNRRHGTFKYGLAVAKDHRRKGYAKEMVHLLLNYYFAELGYQKVTPHVYSFNKASIHLHEKMGFITEGRLRSMIYSDGQNHDEIHFGMTREEFFQSK